jgi:hypothetical protein
MTHHQTIPSIKEEVTGEEGSGKKELAGGLLTPPH